MCKTKAGKGFKVVVDGQWFYTSNMEFFGMINGDLNACQFRSIDNKNNKQKISMATALNLKLHKI